MVFAVNELFVMIIPLIYFSNKEILLKKKIFKRKRIKSVFNLGTLKQYKTISAMPKRILNFKNRLFKNKSENQIRERSDEDKSSTEKSSTEKDSSENDTLSEYVSSID